MRWWWFTFRSRILWWRSLYMDEEMTWLPTWWHFLKGEFFGGQVSWATSTPRIRNLAFGELQLECKYFFLREIFSLLFSLFSMTVLGDTRKSRIIEVSSSHLCDKWCKFVLHLREYENISNMSFKIYTMSLSNICRWYEIITYISNKYKYSRELLR